MPLFSSRRYGALRPPGPRQLFGSNRYREPEGFVQRNPARALAVGGFRATAAGRSTAALALFTPCAAGLAVPEVIEDIEADCGREIALAAGAVDTGDDVGERLGARGRELLEGVPEPA